MPVVIRLKPLSETVALIDSFQAKDVVRTLFTQTIVSQEWRIPEYTYMLNVPMLMVGKKSAAEKERDELVKSLSPNDRLVFEHIGKGRCLAVEAWFKEEPMPIVVRRYEGRLKEVERKMMEAKDQPGTFAELDAQQKAIYDELMGREDVQKFLRGKVEKCLAEAGMSQEGRRAVANSLLRALGPSGQR